METYVILHFDGLRLLLPQHSIISVEVIEDLLPLKPFEVEEKQANIVGWVYLERQQNPVYCLSNQLNLRSNIPSKHEVIVVLQIQQGLFGITCERIEPIAEHVPLLLKTVPNCMHSSDSPIEHLAIYQNKIGHISSAEHLADYLFP